MDTQISEASFDFNGIAKPPLLQQPNLLRRILRFAQAGITQASKV